MIRRAHKAKVSFINDRVDILNRNAVETFPAKQVFRTVNAILSLVRVGAHSAPARELSLMIQQGQDD